MAAAARRGKEQKSEWRAAAIDEMSPGWRRKPVQREGERERERASRRVDTKEWRLKIDAGTEITATKRVEGEGREFSRSDGRSVVVSVRSVQSVSQSASQPANLKD